MAQAPSILTCDCGSTFFFIVRAEQFQAGGYGSAEFRSISNSPKTTLICLCGQPFTPKPAFVTRGTVAAAQEDAFRKSVESAQKYRKDHSMNHIAEITVSPAELQEVETRVIELAKTLETLRPLPLVKKIKASKVVNDGKSSQTSGT